MDVWHQNFETFPYDILVGRVNKFEKILQCLFARGQWFQNIPTISTKCIWLKISTSRIFTFGIVWTSSVLSKKPNDQEIDVGLVAEATIPVLVVNMSPPSRDNSWAHTWIVHGPPLTSVFQKAIWMQLSERSSNKHHQTFHLQHPLLQMPLDSQLAPPVTASSTWGAGSNQQSSRIETEKMWGKHGLIQKPFWNHVSIFVARLNIALTLLGP